MTAPADRPRPEAPMGALINRELSWLAFNDRVLDEAADSRVPLLARLRFLGIFSNNQDEFFRVRVASLRRLATVGKTTAEFPNTPPAEVLAEIQRKVEGLQEKFGRVYDDLLLQLRQAGIDIIGLDGLRAADNAFLRRYFANEVSPYIVPLILTPKAPFPYLRDRALYLAVRMASRRGARSRHALIEIPVSRRLSRFVVLPGGGQGAPTRVLLLDDLVRYCFDEIFFMFEYDSIEAYTVKITRDSEIDIDTDISKSFVEKMATGVERRRYGSPVRFVYDRGIEPGLLRLLAGKLGITDRGAMLPGERYHNFRDYIAFPSLAPELENVSPPPLPHPDIDASRSIIDAVRRKDIMLHYPYQSFGHYVDFLREAAVDPRVTDIKITLYRIADNSKVMNALINAVKNGKEVTAVIELLARFDEQANIAWSKSLQEAGVRVINGVPGLKVHAKLTCVTRVEGAKEHAYCYIGTGNFNESTAAQYCDDGLLTASPDICAEVQKVFEFLKSNYKRFNYSHLLVAPYGMRKQFVRLINNEIRNCREGLPAYIHLKLNNLVDETLIKQLYAAARAGVKVKLIVRGICALRADLPELNGNVEAISIVDKYLEHSRFQIFANGGDELYYISSADWMIRNMDRRVEIAAPIYSPGIRAELRRIFDIQWSDNVKSRVLDSSLSNAYRAGGGEPVRAQAAIYQYLAGLARCGDANAAGE